MIKWNKRFDYPASIRSLVNDQRHYEIGEQKYPNQGSVLPSKKELGISMFKSGFGGKPMVKLKINSNNLVFSPAK